MMIVSARLVRKPTKPGKNFTALEVHMSLTTTPHVQSATPPPGDMKSAKSAAKPHNTFTLTFSPRPTN